MDTMPTAPLIIGVVGKRRTFLGAQVDAVAQSMRACFTLLDEAFPSTPKILLSGLASGSDSIALEQALLLGWAAVAVLPFELDLFLEDLDEDERATLQSLKDDTRVRVLSLSALLDPATGKPVSRDALARANDTEGTHRGEHHEQLGLFIAERAALLIGVLQSDEQPDRLGGTARIVDYRVRGEPDNLAKSVIARSTELHARGPLDHPGAGPAWIIDLKAGNGSQPSGLERVQCWCPISPPRMLPGFRGVVEAGARAIHLRSAVDPEAPVIIEKSRLGDRRRLLRPLQLARSFESFNRKLSALQLESKPAASCGTTPSAKLLALRSAASAMQASYKRALRRAAWSLAGLFMLGICFFELHTGFHLSIGPYVATFLVVLMLYFWARRQSFQQYAEDYRAVAEALRVQLVWWEAGMTGREYEVASSFLVGAVGSLALVRTATRQIVDALVIQSSLPKPAPAAVRDWINGQIAYFRSRISSRVSRLEWARGSIWFLSLCSLGLATSLLDLWKLIPFAVLGSDRARLMTLFAMVPTAVVTWELATRAQGRAVRQLFSGINLLPGLVFGLIAGQTLERLADAAAHPWISLLVVMTATAAGGTHYLIETFVLEAELHSYQRMLGLLTRAAQELALDGSAPLSGEQQKFLFSLGKLALEENESWITAHRVRPLEPMH